MVRQIPFVNVEAGFSIGGISVNIVTSIVQKKLVTELIFQAHTCKKEVIQLMRTGISCLYVKHTLKVRENWKSTIRIPLYRQIRTKPAKNKIIRDFTIIDPLRFDMEFDTNFILYCIISSQKIIGGTTSLRLLRKHSC